MVDRISFSACVLLLSMIVPLSESKAADEPDGQLAQLAVRAMAGRFQQNQISLERLWGGFRKVKFHLAPDGVSAEIEAIELRF